MRNRLKPGDGVTIGVLVATVLWVLFVLWVAS